MASVNEATVGPEDISWREVRRILEEEIARLPEELRSPIILCLFQGQTQEEAGRNLHVNPRTVKDRLRRGRELLQRRLIRRGITLGVLGALLSAGSTKAAVSASLIAGTVQAAKAFVSKAPLVGIVSPAVLTLAGSSSVLAGWGWAFLLGTLLLGSAAYVIREQLQGAPPQRVVANKEPAKVHRSFLGKQFDDNFFQYSAPHSQKFIRREEEGLRITLPAQKGPALPVGIALRHPVRGDFELETTWNILDIARPTTGWSAGATVYLFMESAKRDGLWLGKMSDRTRGPVFEIGRRIDSSKERVNKFVKAVASPQQIGPARLRVVRQGSQLRFFAADGDDDAWDFLHEETVSPADLRIIRLAADPVFRDNLAMDVRLADFSITAEEIVGYAPHVR